MANHDRAWPAQEPISKKPKITHCHHHAQDPGATAAFRRSPSINGTDESSSAFKVGACREIMDEQIFPRMKGNHFAILQPKTRYCSLHHHNPDTRYTFHQPGPDITGMDERSPAFKVASCREIMDEEIFTRITDERAFFVLPMVCKAWAHWWEYSCCNPKWDQGLENISDIMKLSYC